MLKGLAFTQNDTTVMGQNKINANDNVSFANDNGRIAGFALQAA